MDDRRAFHLFSVSMPTGKEVELNVNGVSRVLVEGVEEILLRAEPLLGQ